MRETATASFDFVSLSRQPRSKKIKFTGLGAMPDHIRLSDLEPLFVWALILGRSLNREPRLKVAGGATPGSSA
jgi:hypothetical protein